MKIEYPKIIYRADGGWTTVNSKEEHDKIVSIFPSEEPAKDKELIYISSALIDQAKIGVKKTLQASKDRVVKNKDLNGNDNR